MNEQCLIKHHFSLAFQQMCSLVAIGQTKSPEETLRELILHTLVLLPEERISSENEFSKILDSLFGLQISDHEIKYVIDRLTKEGAIRLSESSTFILDAKLSVGLKNAIDKSIDIEHKVRDRWFEEISTKYSKLVVYNAWTALRNYLAGAFLRHGIQAVKLLDSSLYLDNIHSQSLSDLLQDAVKGFPKEVQQDAKNAIANFVATAGQFPERATYISQLADGAFSYFNLSSDPDTSKNLRKNISPLFLFLDTNFLFGILGLTVNSQVAVSNDLIKIIQQHKFPFTLKRYKKTENELIKSISKYEFDLSRKIWSKSISRAAITSRFINGVELKYHQTFIETGIDVKSFFLPYNHADVLLNEKNIENYEADIADEKSQQRISMLIGEYEEFLKSKDRNKSYQLKDHDMTLLDIVRQLRTDARSTLDARALIITCDYGLYAFDWENSAKHGLKPCTVLPNLFWQILRPFIPSDDNFSQAFAQTFAIPEFRTLGSGAAEACSKMINIMSAYKDFPEDTAKRMLSNDVLIEKLRKAENDEVFQNYVEEAIVSENAQLLGENILLTKKVETEQAEKKEVTKRLEETTEIVKQKEENIKIVQAQRMIAEEATQTANDGRHKSEEKLALIISLIKAIIMGIVSIGVFEILVYKIPWNWLIIHTNSYGIQGSIDLLLIIINFILFVPKWRKSIVFALAIPFIALILSLLGGPR